MKQKHAITLTTDERKQIQKIANNPTTSNTIRKRANILLLADNNPGKPLPQIEMAKRCDTSDITVYNTLKNYTTHGLTHTLKFKRAKTTTLNHNRRHRSKNHSPSMHRTTQRLRTLDNTPTNSKNIIELQIIPNVFRETIRNTLKKQNFAFT
jgi:hypothetical protein